MRLAALFLWLALPLGLYAVNAAYGTPHIVWGYTFLDNGDRNNPFAARHYTSCTYIGWRWHTVTLPARNANCPWVRLIKASGQ